LIRQELKINIKITLEGVETITFYDEISEYNKYFKDDS